jgi:hypothetical protein
MCLWHIKIALLIAKKELNHEEDPVLLIFCFSFFKFVGASTLSDLNPHSGNEFLYKIRERLSKSPSVP